MSTSYNKTARGRAKKTRDTMRGVQRQRRRPTALLNEPPAGRTRTQRQKTSWTLLERRRWWIDLPETSHEPFPPHPRDKVAEKDLAQAKLQAVEAMHEFGVLVEASRASGMGRFQLEWALRKNPDGENDFRADMLRAKRECQERLEGAFIARGRTRGGDLAGIFYLKHNRERYREIQRVELTGKDGAPFNALESAKAEILIRLGKLAAESAGSREGLEGKQQIVVGGSAGSARPQLVKGSETEVTRAVPRKKRKD